jgi:hypothetical protein
MRSLVCKNVGLGLTCPGSYVENPPSRYFLPSEIEETLYFDR